MSVILREGDSPLWATYSSLGRRLRNHEQTRRSILVDPKRNEGDLYHQLGQQVHRQLSSSVEAFHSTYVSDISVTIISSVQQRCRSVMLDESWEFTRMRCTALSSRTLVLALFIIITGKFNGALHSLQYKRLLAPVRCTNVTWKALARH